MTTIVSLIEVFRELRLANNGYTFSSGMTSEYIRRADQLVARGVAQKGFALNMFNKQEIVYFVTPVSIAQ
jgi:hypothetical protein